VNNTYNALFTFIQEIQSNAELMHATLLINYVWLIAQ